MSSKTIWQLEKVCDCGHNRFVRTWETDPDKFHISCVKCGKQFNYDGISEMNWMFTIKGGTFEEILQDRAAFKLHKQEAE